MSLFVQRVSNDNLIKELKGEMLSKFIWCVSDVKVITETKHSLILSFYDNKNKHMKSFYLNDFYCEQNYNKKSESEQIGQDDIEESTVERTWIRFLKKHYPEYKEAFLAYKNSMAELQIGK